MQQKQIQQMQQRLMHHSLHQVDLASLKSKVDKLVIDKIEECTN